MDGVLFVGFGVVVVVYDVCEKLCEVCWFVWWFEICVFVMDGDY